MNKLFWKDAGIRALRTFSQTVVALLGTDTLNIISIDWTGILSAAVGAALISILNSISRIQTSDEVIVKASQEKGPEAPEKDEPEVVEIGSESEVAEDPEEDEARPVVGFTANTTSEAPRFFKLSTDK